jgi:type II secretory pathway component PulM
VFAPDTTLSCAEQQGLQLERLHNFSGGEGLVEHARAEWPQLLDWVDCQPHHLRGLSS